MTPDRAATVYIVVGRYPSRGPICVFSTREKALDWINDQDDPTGLQAHPWNVDAMVGR